MNKDHRKGRVCSHDMEKAERSRLSTLWRLYIGEFFHDDERLWSRRKEPYIFYKHLFRKFVWTKVDKKSQIQDLEKYVTDTKPNHTTIYNSLDENPNNFKLTPKELKRALTFLNKYYDVSLEQTIKTKIMKAHNMGYTTEDIARHCRVHENVVIDILQDKKVPYNLLKEMERELDIK